MELDEDFLPFVLHSPLPGLYRPWHKQGTRLEEFIHLSHLLPAINYFLHLIKIFKQKAGIRRDETKEIMKKIRKMVKETNLYFADRVHFGVGSFEGEGKKNQIHVIVNGVKNVE